MPPWKPTLRPGVDLRTLPLTPEEGFVASRLDGVTDLHGLSLVTGFTPDRIDAALSRLAALGAVAPERKPGPETATGSSPTPATEDAPEPPHAPGEEPLAEDDEEDEGIAETAGATHRALYETALHPLHLDERCAKAKLAEDPELSAFCFDPVPAVIQALLENRRFALAQARLVAAHHRNPVGIDALAAHAQFAADAGVRRALLRNPQLPMGLLRRLYAGRRMLEQHKLALSRDLPEQTRRTLRELVRARFATAVAEEKLELLIKTEGRCLASLVGLPVDGKTAALLCGRTYASATLVQNLARWSAAPPTLIAHLLRQDLVRRMPMLRTILQRHPNAPAEARR